MDPNTKNLFTQFLREEFEKKKDKNVDVVAEKRKRFSVSLEQAHFALRKKLYEEAACLYYKVILFLENDPYPDELNLSNETSYSIKCCFCYSSLMSSDRFQNDDTSRTLLDVMRDLNDKFKTRLFPMFLLVLLNFHRKNWLTTLTWCDGIRGYIEEETDGKVEGTDFFKELLPSTAEIKLEVANCEEMAFFGYGEKLTRRNLLYPTFDKYKSWAYNIDDFLASKIVKIKAPVSDADLHLIFHRDIFPIWCLASGKDSVNYYSEKYLTSCAHCMRAKIHDRVSDKKEILAKDQSRFERYVDLCVEYYQKNVSKDEVDLFDVSSGKNKSEVEDKPVKKVTVSTTSQTKKGQYSNKHIQTDNFKTRNIEVQVNNDSSVLSAIKEIKTKCLAQQEKKDETISKLHNKISELQEKLNKEIKSRKMAEVEFEKKTVAIKVETERQTAQIAELEKNLKKETDKTHSLHMLLFQQIGKSYLLQKQHYKNLDHQASYMITYLKELEPFLSPKSIPDEISCRRNIEIWENNLQSVKDGADQLDIYNQTIKTNLLESDVCITWPELPQFPRLEDNIVFQTYQAAIRNIIETEEKLYRKQANNYQPLTLNYMQRATPLPSPTSVPYCIQRSPFPPQNNLYLGSRLMYTNGVATAVPSPYNPQLSHPPWRPQADFESTAQGFGRSEPAEFLNRKYSAAAGNQENAAQSQCDKNTESPKDVILLDHVMERCLGFTEGEVTLALLKVLDQHKGTLSDVPKETIVKEVKVVLRGKRQTAWVTPKQPCKDWNKDHSENECSICFEEYTAPDKYTLPCRHEYHKECIKKWLQTSSVCPICRVHSVIDEDFPPLH